MKSRDFCYWIQGFFEMSESQHLTAKQVEMIKRHLQLVFKYEIDPSMGNDKIQDALNDIHKPTVSSAIPPLDTLIIARC